ncbi:hypothetical protein SAMN05920897_11024 [Alkalispirochaeta americana]|uniref:Helicase conserved C-terminal domain-containing protein n=1 Tax=Alkalispirochaeta americana TaxID=159291 RepID=A0A1N6TEE4_9SPIO|nr:hypothetical protein [Alkalispirochaeta americana]SIQ51705.1 hypothetical protein SAMN05920897_11024 [Alkalispirochaeta americana]
MQNRGIPIISNTGQTESAFSRYLLSLEDESFFALIRNYLGPVRTPYNKHDLIAKLVEFLSREETRRAIRARIDGDDEILLAATALLGQPGEDQLYHFLEDQLDYGRFRWLLLNHRDRLLLIDGFQAGTVQINPLLAQTTLQEAIDPQRLIEGEPLAPSDEAASGEFPWLSAAFATALYAFLREDPDLYTQAGKLRKRSIARLNDRFGTLLTGEEGEQRLATALQALTTLQLLVHRQEEGLVLFPDAWDELADLPEEWIQALLWGAPLTHSVEEAFDIAALLISFSATVPCNRSFTPVEILRIFRLTGAGSGLPLPGTGETPSLLAAMGLLLPLDAEEPSPDNETGTGTDRPARFRLNPTAASLLKPPETSPGGVSLQATMEMNVPPGTPFRDRLDLARIAALRRFDVMVVLELSRESLSSALREDQIAARETILRICGASLPQNVDFLLRRWQDRLQAVRLIRGVVLVVDQEAEELLGASEQLDPFIQERLAPGVMIISPDAVPQVEQHLRALGFHGSVRLESVSAGGAPPPEYRRFLQRHRGPALAPPVPRHARRDDLPRTTGSALPDGMQELHATEESLKATLDAQNLPQEAARELALRIEGKLILFPEQINPDVVPRHGIEAKGLDYLGKVRLVEQAIQEGELLEVIMRTAEGAPRRLLLRPREIVQSGEDLMLRALELPQEKPLRVRIRRASLVRRLSGALLRSKKAHPGGR